MYVKSRLMDHFLILISFFLFSDHLITLPIFWHEKSRLMKHHSTTQRRKLRTLSSRLIWILVYECVRFLKNSNICIRIIRCNNLWRAFEESSDSSFNVISHILFFLKYFFFCQMFYILTEKWLKKKSWKERKRAHPALTIPAFLGISFS